MGIRDKVRSKIGAAMLGKLADVSYAFTAIRTVKGTWNPNGDTPSTELDYSGSLIGGLSFTDKDSPIFQIQELDQKAILMSDKTDQVPEIGDMVVFDLGLFRVENLSIIPAGIGWVLQLRCV